MRLRQLFFCAAVLITVLCVILANCLTELLAGNAAVVVACVLLALLCGVCFIIICRQPESKEALTFKVRCQLSSEMHVLCWDRARFM